MYLYVIIFLPLCLSTSINWGQRQISTSKMRILGLLWPKIGLFGPHLAKNWPNLARLLKNLWFAYLFAFPSSSTSIIGGQFYNQP